MTTAATAAPAPRALRVTDLTFRDGHQSLFATRVRTDDLAAIAPEMDRSASGRWRSGAAPPST